VAEVRHAFTKAGGNLGTDGSVAYLFTRFGVISFPSGANEEQILEAALDAGADDVITHDDQSIEVRTGWESYMKVKESLAAAGLIPQASEVTMIASTTSVLDLEGAEKILRLIEVLEDLDDVQNVYTNAEIPDEIIQQLS